MYAEIVITVLLGAMLILFVAVPLIPAVVIYKLFPKTPLVLKGPLGGMTLNTGGAFAAYLIVAWISRPVSQQAVEAVAGYYHPVWMVEIPFEIHDAENKKVNLRRLLGQNFDVSESMNLLIKPEFNRVTAGQKLLIRIPGLERVDWPTLTVQLPGYGSGDLDLIPNTTKNLPYKLAGTTPIF